MNLETFVRNPFFWALISMFGLLGAAAVTSSRRMASQPVFFLGSLLLPALGHTMMVLPFVDQLRFESSGWHWFVGGGLLLASLVFEVAGFLPARKFKEKDAQVRLKIAGFYSIVRHPMYVGDILYALGIAFVFRSVIGVALVPVWFSAFMFLLTIEEEILEERLGATYMEYKKRVPGRLFPQGLPARQEEIIRYPFKNLVMKGGGIRGIAYAGVLQELEERGILPQIERVSGASAGAITAMVLSFRLDMDETMNVMDTLDFSKIPQSRLTARRDEKVNFLLKEFNVITDNLVCTQRLVEEFGWYTTEYFYEWLQQVVAQRCDGNGRATFADFRDRGFRDLYVTAANISKRRSEMFSAATTPDVAVADAVRMSIAIPLYFHALQFDGQQFGAGDYYVDGGLYDNFPIRYFDNEQFGKQNRWYKSRINWATLGSYLYTPKDCVKADSQFNNIIDYVSLMVSEMALNIRDEMFSRETLDQLRTIMISDCCIDQTDFNIPTHSERYDQLIESGRAATKIYLDEYRAPDV
ncbi:MAG: patatin-like phospholipase family protein [Anaerolineaceae bacterium]|jgi:NTE family protein|nr:patatin-like phospholipase family protein [Anaerolineaceae bacterium]